MIWVNSCSFGKIRSGQSAQASFRLMNLSSSAPLHIRTVFSDADGVSADYPAIIPPGETSSIAVTIPPSALSRGQNNIKVSVQTDSPLMQILDFYINGKVE